MAEDRKFKYENGRYINRVSGEPIPDDEPIMILRARDQNTLPLLEEYMKLCNDPHHRIAIADRIAEFTQFKEANPMLMKEPGVSRHIVLNSELDKQ